jgi:hypothetical protein
LLIATTALVVPLAACGATYGDSAWRGGGLSVGAAPVGGYWGSPYYRYGHSGSHGWWQNEGGEEGGERGEKGGGEGGESGESGEYGEEGGDGGESGGHWGEEGGEQGGGRDREWSKKDRARWNEQGEEGERSWRDGEGGERSSRSGEGGERGQADSSWRGTDRDVNDVHAW